MNPDQISKTAFRRICRDLLPREKNYLFKEEAYDALLAGVEGYLVERFEMAHYLNGIRGKENLTVDIFREVDRMPVGGIKPQLNEQRIDEVLEDWKTVTRRSARRIFRELGAPDLVVERIVNQMPMDLEDRKVEPNFGINIKRPHRFRPGTIALIAKRRKMARTDSY